MGKWGRLWTAVKVGAAVAMTVKQTNPHDKKVVEAIVKAVDKIAKQAQAK